MPANWGTFTSAFTAYLTSQVAQDEGDTADMIGTLYVAAVATALVNVGSAPIVPPSSSTIASGFEASFLLAKSAGSAPITPATFMPAAGAIIGEYAKLTIIPMPPMPPCIAPTVGYKVLFPGEPGSLASLLAAAFSAQSEATTASMLASAFTTHLTTVTGIYLGMIPSAPSPIPGPPIPWVGIA
jgi:hypothetical protein